VVLLRCSAFLEFVGRWIVLLRLWPLLVASLVISMGLTPAFRNVGVRLKVLDTAHDLRRVHSRPVPRLGGLAIVLGTFGGIAAGLVIPVVRAAILEDGWSIFGLMLGGLFVAAAGLYDDVMGARATKKLAVEIVAAALLYAAGFRILAIDNPFGGDIELGPFSLPVTLLWIAGVANAMNLIDGLDGLAGGVAVFGAGAICVLGVRVGDPTTVVMALAVAGGVLGFLVYNVSPASVFMGDTGSLFLGTMLAALALRPHDDLALSVPLTAMSVVLGIPILDTLLAIGRRAARNAPLFSGDREHLHHRLLDRGLSPRAAVVALWSVSALLATAGVHMAPGRDPRGRAVIFSAVILISLILLSILGYFRRPDAAMRERRRRNRERLNGVRAVSLRLRHASSVEDVYRLVRTVAPVFGAQAARLRNARPSSEVPGRRLFPLDPSDLASRLLELEWSPEHQLDRDTEVAIEILCRGTSSVLDRLERRNVAAPPQAAPQARRRDLPVPARALSGQQHLAPPSLH